MAYADRKMSSNRVTSLVIVALIHALLGYAFVTGLAYNVVKKVNKDLNVFDVEEEPPPPEEEPPPPPPDQPVQPPPMVTPPPIVRMNTPPPQMVTQREIPPTYVPTYTAPPAPPAPVVAPPPPPPPPPPAVKQQAARARGSIPGLFSDADYPESAIRSEDQGTVRASLTIGTNGRVTGCTVTQSSGSSSLDSATCRILRSRAKYTPAVDSNGRPTTDTVTTPPIRWVLPEE